jgi:hypothetical protein
MTFPLNLYSLNSILPHLSLICQNKFFDQGLHIFWFFFLFFYPLKLVIGFANVTSFKLKIMTLFSTSTIPLNLFMKIILSLTWHIYCHSYYLFISFIPNIHYSLKPHYFDPMCFIIIIICFLFTGVYRISSLTSMCITDSVRWGVWTSPISSLTGMCFSAIVQWRLFASPNKFGDEVVWCIESVHWRVSASAYQFPDEVVRSRESICWRVCASVNQFFDEVVHPWISSLTSCASLKHSAEESMLCRPVRWRDSVV